MPEFLTVGDVAKTFGRPDWEVRKVIDSLDANIPRVGLYRLISRSLLPRIGAELEKRRRAHKREAAACN